MGIPCWSVGPLNGAGRHVQVGHGMLDHQPWVSHVDGRAYIGLTEIALEAARDSSFPYDCFGFLMRQRLLAAFPGTLSGLRLLPSPSSLFVRWLPLPASLPLCVLVCGLLSLCFGLLLCLLVCFCLVLLVCSSLFVCWIGGLCLLPAY